MSSGRSRPARADLHSLSSGWRRRSLSFLVHGRRTYLHLLFNDGRPVSNDGGRFRRGRGQTRLRFTKLSKQLIMLMPHIRTRSECSRASVSANAFSPALPASVRLGTKLACTCSKSASEIPSPRALPKSVASPLAGLGRRLLRPIRRSRRKAPEAHVLRRPAPTHVAVTASPRAWHKWGSLPHGPSP